MRTLTATLTLVVLSTITATGQESSAAQPYEGVDAYEVYNLLLPHEESYAFAEDVLMIQENAVAQDISGACLRQADANRFKGAIADYNRAREKKWLVQRHFQIAKSYRIVGAEAISPFPTIRRALFHTCACRQWGSTVTRLKQLYLCRVRAEDSVGVGGFISLRRSMANGKRQPSPHARVPHS